MEQTAAAHSQAVHFQSEGYGLRRGVLSPMETLAQSVSTIAPTTTPAATIPLVCALAGNGTWLAYLLATMAVLLVALCISRFARYSASPGSLYRFASMILPPWLGAVVAWSLLLAYIATGASVIGGHRALHEAAEDHPAERSAWREEIDRALGRLRPEQREAFLLKYVEELGYDEMSRLTGAGVSALKMRVMRACDRLRELLSDVRDSRGVREERRLPEVNDARHS